MISGNENFVFKFNEIEYFEIKIQSIFFIFLFLFILKNIYLIFYYWWIAKFTWMTYSTQVYIYLKDIFQTISFFLKKNNLLN